MKRKFTLVLIVLACTKVFSQNISNEIIRDGDTRFLYIMDYTDENGSLSTTVYILDFTKNAEDINFVETKSYSNRLGREIRNWTISAYVTIDNMWYFVRYDLSSDSCGEAPVLYCQGKMTGKSFGENVYEFDSGSSGFKTKFNCEYAVKHYDEKEEMFQEGNIVKGYWIPQKVTLSSLDVNESYFLPDNGTELRKVQNKIQSMIVKTIDSQLVGRNRYGFD